MSTKKREDIQCLRAIAIIMVLLFHFFPLQFPNGYVGVDMFFVISGYFISMVFPKDFNTKSLADFYYRRVKRILPLYYLTILMVLVVTVVFAPVRFVKPNLVSGNRAILLMSNVVNGQTTQVNYQMLITNAENLFTHCWSLCLEMQWYLLAPVVFFFRSSRVCFCQAIFLLSAFYHISSDENTSFNSVFARLWQFLAGILANEFQQNSSEKENEGLIKSQPRNEISLLSHATWLHLTTLLLGFLPVIQHPTSLRLLTTAATSALLSSGSSYQIPLLQLPKLSWIGNISYSLYLVHWPIYITAKNYEHPIGIPIGLSVSVFIATIVYYSFELRYLRWEKRTILLLVGSLFAASLHCSMNGMALRRWVYSEKSLEEMVAERNATMPWLAMNLAEGSLDVTERNLGSPLCKYGRLFGIPMPAPFGHCEMPNGNGSYNMLVIGNSWATNQGPTLVYSNFLPFAKKFDVFSIAGCEPLLHSPGSACKNTPNYGRLAVDHFKPDVLFVLQRALSYLDPIDETEDIGNDLIFSEFLNNLVYFEKRVKKIYLQQAVPWIMTTPAVEAMIKENKTLADLGDSVVTRDEKFARIRMDELTKRCKNCALIDFLPYFPVGSNGLPVPYDLTRNLLFFDDSMHLDRFGMEQVQPLFKKLVDDFKMNL